MSLPELLTTRIKATLEPSSRRIFSTAAPTLAALFICAVQEMTPNSNIEMATTYRKRILDIPFLNAAKPQYFAFTGAQGVREYRYRRNMSTKLPEHLHFPKINLQLVEITRAVSVISFSSFRTLLLGRCNGSAFTWRCITATSSPTTRVSFAAGRDTSGGKLECAEACATERDFPAQRLHPMPAWANPENYH